MADKTRIEWTDATWNPVLGCMPLSPGCTNCYAMRLSGTRLKNHPSRAGLTADTNAGPVWNGEVRLMEKWLRQPLRWTRPRMIFVVAHGDLFFERVPETWIDQVLAVIALAPRHTFQMLTKRADRMQAYFRDPSWRGRVALAASELGERFGVACTGTVKDLGACRIDHLPNVWLGVSAERQSEYDARVPLLMGTRAALRWVSLEPLLGPIDLRLRRHGGGVAYRLDWIVAGGESQLGSRPSHPDWFRSIRDEAASADIPFSFKQWGDWLPALQLAADGFAMWETGGGKGVCHVFDDGPRAFRIGKGKAGRYLDGTIHDAFPSVQCASEKGENDAL